MLSTLNHPTSLNSAAFLDRYDKILRIRINHAYAGFFSYVTFVLNQLQYCEKNNFLPVVYFGAYSEDGPNAFYDERFGENTWDYYFEPVVDITMEDVWTMIQDPSHPLSNDDVVELDTQYLWTLHAYDPDSIYNYPYGYYKDANIENMEIWYEKQREKARYLLTKYVRPKPHIGHLVETFYNTHLNGHNILGIHMRGSDKGAADASPQFMRVIEPREYFPHIDRYLEKAPDSKIFLATEQAQFVSEVRARYGDRLVTRNVIRTEAFGSGSNPFQKKDSDAYFKGEEVLIDCLLLAKSDFLLRCTSAVGEYAVYFNKNIKCIDLNCIDTEQKRISVDNGANGAQGYGANITNPDNSTLPKKPTQIQSGDESQRGKPVKDFFGSGRLFEGCLLINLDSRAQRLERSLSELRPFGLDSCVTRLSAFEHEHGMYGCSVSHIEAVRYARWKGWKSVVIFEDDIKISTDFDVHAPIALGELAKRNWGLFQFGAMFLDPGHVEHLSPHLFRFRYAQAAHAFALHEQCYDYLIDRYVCELDRGNWENAAHYPFDEFLNNHLAHDFNAYGSTKLLISQHPGVSDTWNTQMDYRNLIEEAYEQIGSSSQNHSPTRPQ